MTVITGTRNAESLSGGSGDDLIKGLGGSDILNGGAGDDRLEGGTGDDFLQGGAGSDSLYGGEGNDDLGSSEGTDRLAGGIGDDHLRLSASSRVTGVVRLLGEDGNDTLVAGTSGVADFSGLLYGGAGDDALTATGVGRYDLRGDDGADVITVARFSSMSVSGGTGDDVITAYLYRASEVATATIRVDAGEGDDRVTLSSPDQSVTATVTLGQGRDTLELNSLGYGGRLTVTDFTAGSGGDDMMLLSVLNGFGNGRGDNPFATGHLRIVQTVQGALIQARGGELSAWSDVILLAGVNAADLTADNFYGLPPDGSEASGRTIVGTAGDDYVRGGFGDDLIDGAAGNDTLQGFTGDDVIYGRDGADTIYGGLGVDQLFGGARPDLLMDEGGGSDQLFGERGDDQIFIERRTGDLGRPLGDGGDGNDVIGYRGLTAGGAVDLRGGAGDDEISISNGADFLITGDAGNDVVSVRSSRDGLVSTGDGADVVYMTMDGGGGVAIDLGAGDDLVDLDVWPASEPGTVIVTLGEGQDHLAVRAINGGTVRFVRVTDFEAGDGGDVFDVAALLPGLGGDPFGLGFLRLVQVGDDVRLDFDANGGGNRWRTVLTFEDVQASTFTADNFGGYAPLAVAPADWLLG